MDYLDLFLVLLILLTKGFIYFSIVKTLLKLATIPKLLKIFETHIYLYLYMPSYYLGSAIHPVLIINTWPKDCYYCHTYISL